MAVTTCVPLGEGWDSTAVLVDGTWVERTARRAEVEPWLRTETRVLDRLGPRLPLPVPRPAVVGEDPLVVRHRLVPGEPLTAPTAEHGAAIGRFLRVLHDVPPAASYDLGVPDPVRTRAMRDAAVARFHRDVVPRLPADRHDTLRALLARIAVAPAQVLVHGDLSGDHVLALDGTITGVIDWGDLRAGDPAKDLAWALHATPRACSAAVAEAYGATPDLVARARDWLDVGPCYAVAHGLDTGDDALVAASVDLLARTCAPG